MFPWRSFLVCSKKCWIVCWIDINKKNRAYITFGSHSLLCQQNILTLLPVISVKTTLVCVLFSKMVIVNRFLPTSARFVFYVLFLLKFNETSRSIYISLIIYLWAGELSRCSEWLRARRSGDQFDNLLRRAARRGCEVWWSSVDYRSEWWKGGRSVYKRPTVCS